MRIRIVLKKIWRHSWLVTLPAALLFLLWATQTAETYWNLAVRYDPAGVPMRLRDFGGIEFRKGWQSLKVLFAPADRPTDGGTLPVINLFVAESGLAQLDSRLPHSGFEYVKGALWDDDREEMLKVKVRYRGDFAYHWAFPKKSLRVKTKKAKLYQGLRRFNLVVPKQYEQINGYLSYRLAALMGLLTPRAELVTLAVNGRRQGLYLLVEQLEELTLRRQGRMPGDIFAGELLAKDSYPGLDDENLFRHASLWDKVAVNNHYPEEARASLERLVALLERSDPAAAAELATLLDIPAWAKFSAYLTLCQSNHFDIVHNWRLYYDPARSRFYPVVWDPMGFSAYFAPDLVNNELMDALYRNADFLRARTETLRTFFETGLDRQFLQELTEAARRAGDAVRRDPFVMVSGAPNFAAPVDFRHKRQTPWDWPVEPFRVADSDAVVAAIEDLENHIAASFAAYRELFLEADTPLAYALAGPSTLRLAVAGQPPVRALELELADGVATPRQVRLAYRQSGARVEHDVSGALAVNGRFLHLDLPLVADLLIDRPPRYARKTLARVLPRPAHYELILDGTPLSGALLALRADRGRGFEPVPLAAGAIALDEIQALRVVAHDRPVEAPEVWQGEIEVDGLRTIASAVVIRPGATVRLKPGASLVFKGRLHAVGTPEQPIRFLPAIAGQEPWGTVVLAGPGANGSRLESVVFAGGSGYKDALTEYSGMFSVHDVQGVVVRDGQFRDSRLTDDMVHAVYADIRFEQCTFDNAHADALDLDISRAVVEGCRFRNSGNDALDLMTTQAVVLDTELQASGDKGISVGEGSVLFVHDSRFVANVIGVQVKDGSAATLANVDLLDNGTAVDAYRKNWRYGDGGQVFLYKSRLAGNRELLTADKRSGIRVYDSYLDRAFDSAKKRFRIDPTVDSREPRTARVTTPWRDPDEAQRMTWLAEEYWARVRPERRGGETP